jgi:hypothetical protein
VCLRAACDSTRVFEERDQKPHSLQRASGRIDHGRDVSEIVGRLCSACGSRACQDDTRSSSNLEVVGLKQSRWMLRAYRTRHAIQVKESASGTFRRY